MRSLRLCEVYTGDTVTIPVPRPLTSHNILRQVWRREAEIRTKPNTEEASRDKRRHHHPSVHNNESLEDASRYFVHFYGECPKSRFGHVVRDSYPYFIHFGFSEARLMACSRSPISKHHAFCSWRYSRYARNAAGWGLML